MGHPSTDGTARGRTGSNSTGLSSCPELHWSPVTATFPGEQSTRDSHPAYWSFGRNNVGRTRRRASRGPQGESTNNSIIKRFVWTWRDCFYKPLFFHKVVNQSHQPSPPLGQLLTAPLLLPPLTQYHQWDEKKEGSFKIFLIACKCMRMLKLCH